MLRRRSVYRDGGTNTLRIYESLHGEFVQRLLTRYGSSPDWSWPMVTSHNERYAMAHEVNVQLSSKIVQHKDMAIEVKQDGSLLGRLLVSKGNVEWKPAGNQIRKHQLSCVKFAGLMEAHGKVVR